MIVTETALQKREQYSVEDFALLPLSSQTRDSVVILGNVPTLANYANTNLPLKNPTGAIIVNAFLAGSLLAGAIIGTTQRVRIEQSTIPALAYQDASNDLGVCTWIAGPFSGEFAATTVQCKTALPRKASQASDVAEMVASTQSVRTVADAVFSDVRPLTDREREYLSRFYDRAYKPH